MFKATAGAVTAKIVRPLHQILCPDHAAAENSSVRELEKAMCQACGGDPAAVLRDGRTFAALQSKIVGSSELIRAYGIILSESERSSAVSATWVRATQRLIFACRVRFSNADRWHPNSSGKRLIRSGGPSRAKWVRLLRNVLANCAWREPNLEFQKEFIGDSLLTPGRIFGCHPADQSSHFHRDWWSPDRPRLPTPEAAEGSSMPADQSSRFHDDQSPTPVEKAGQFRQDEAIRGCGPCGFLLTFLK